MSALKKYLGLVSALILLAALFFAASVSASAAEVTVVAVREMESLPASWDPLAAETAEQEFILDLTGGGMYRVDHNNKFIESDLASSLEDVTAEYAGTYGVPETAVRGYAYRISLNGDARWDDGTPITADDWVYSGRRMLETGNHEPLRILANAEGYISGGTHDPQILSLAEAGYGSVAAAMEAGITEFFVDVEHYWGLGEGWRSVRDITRIQDPAMTQGYSEMYISAAWLYDRYLADGQPYAYHQREFVGIAGEGMPLTLEDVGLVRTGDYELVLILQEPESETALVARLAGFPLVREGFSYRTAADSPSYGPYRVSEVTPEGIRLEKNPNWWGPEVLYEQILCR